jgi:hypothetical protein
MSYLLVLNMELESIRSFLERVGKSVDSDYTEIMRRVEAGEFADEDEEGNAFFDPMMSDEIAVRATLGELNALVEWELQQVTVEPLAQEQKAKKSKQNRIVWDLKPHDLYHLIEGYYHISIDDLPGSKEVEEIRRTVNAYKHRKGFKDPRRDTDWTYFPEKFQLEREKALHQVEAVRDFLQALWAATKEKQA